MQKTFLFLYGWGGSGPEHWQSWMADKLRAEGQVVLYPQLPNADTPNLEEWLSVLEDTLKKAKGPLVVLTHSLGVSLWMHYLAQHPELVYEKAFLVSPTRNFRTPGLETFFPLPEVDLGGAKDRTLIVCSDNDPYIPKDEFEELSKDLGVKIHWMPGAGHLNVKAGYGPFPWLYQEAVSE